jgi:release factor glutamine methyltransferase
MTINEGLECASAVLKKSGIETNRLDARVLLAYVLNCEQEFLFGHPEISLQREESQLFSSLIQRRSQREPVSRIIGQREFWGLSFQVSSATLDPRSDSETVVHAALEFLKDRQPALTILDLGVGGGCLLLSLLYELPHAFGIGIDQSHEALRTARNNALSLGLIDRTGFIVSDWVSALSVPFDLIISNPPYIKSADIPQLPDEVRKYDPLKALDGGEDGLYHYRKLAPQLYRLLKPQGFAIFEHGQGQSGSLERIFKKEGLSMTSSFKDLAGISRCAVFEK